MFIIEFNKDKLIKSPLNYVGGKYKLLPQILPLFPDKVDSFIDLFCGGCNVGVNVNASQITCNDINTYLIRMLQYFKNNKVKYILEQIDITIDKYKLNKYNKESFWKLRNDFNDKYNPIHLYVLICFSFNQRMRISTKNKYNSAFREGLNGYNEKLKEKLFIFLEKLHNINIKYINEDFNNILVTQKDFVYADPPYLITNADYCKEGVKEWRWNDKKELELLNYLDNLNNKKIKFALNNVLEHHGRSNDILKEWSKKYIIHDLNYTYGNFNSQSTKKDIKNTIEVLITNY